MKKLIHLCVLFYALSLQAQDPMLIQFQNQKLELNPAYGGHSGPGSLHLAFAGRTSFYPVRGPFSYSSAAIDFSPCKPENLGIGLLVNKERQGDGYYDKTRIGLNLGYAVPLNKSNSLSFGLRPGIVQQSIDWNEFTFSDQLDPLEGIKQVSFNHQAPLDLSNTMNWDAGIKYNRYKRGSPKYMLGISGFNLIEPKIGLLSTYTLKRRISFHGSVTFLDKNPSRLHRTSVRADFQNTNYLFALNHEVLLENRLGIILGASSPVNTKFTSDVSLFFLSIGASYQPVPSLLIYASYENNGRGKLVRGRTSSFEIGIVLKTGNSLCKVNSLKEAFDFNPNKKITRPMECPNLRPDDKIESF
ncbi:MAG: PorP/SprF family type IX secretion system membrane protein [Bacteroidetes bacterium]|nr:PorP/SprF family type IX secretion system membrane protein [Bacteroidota bacterium]